MEKAVNVEKNENVVLWQMACVTCGGINATIE